MTFDDCRDRYIAAHQSTWRNHKHRKQWTNTLTAYASPKFGKLPVESIDVGLVMQALEPIWTQKPETASRLCGRIEAVLDWAIARGYREGPNPARWRGHLSNLFPRRSKINAVKHYPALPYAELPGFLRDLRSRDGVAALALQFLISTAARTNEVIAAKWDEFDCDARLWVVPAARMKSGREHRVPISAAAMAIVERMKSVRQNDYVFPGERRDRLSDMAMLMLLRRMGRDDLTVHGFRATFKTWASERTGFANEITEAALAHVVGDETERAYRRGDMVDKRRKLMTAWGDYCAAPSIAARIVPLRSA
jgi:integrase